MDPGVQPHMRECTDEEKKENADLLDARGMRLIYVDEAAYIPLGTIHAAIAQTKYEETAD